MRETNLFYPKGEHPIHGTWLSVDVVAFTEGSAHLTLIERQGTPHKGATTLPGGLLAAWDGETVEGAARRIIREKVGVDADGGVVVLDVVSDPLRDERGHTVSIVVGMRVPADTPGAVPVTEVPNNMPFGHTKMVRKALVTLGQRLLVDPVTTYAMLGDTTTVNDVCAMLRVCEQISDSATRARLDRCGLYVRGAARKDEGDVGRPPAIYTRTQ